MVIKTGNHIKKVLFIVLITYSPVSWGQLSFLCVPQMTLDGECAAMPIGDKLLMTALTPSVIGNDFPMLAIGLPDGSDSSTFVHYTGMGYSSIKKAAACPNGDFVIAGLLSHSRGMQDGNHLFLIRISPKGQIIWAKRIGTADPESTLYLYGFGVCPDGSIMLYTPEIVATSPGPTRHVAMKFSEKGELIWSKKVSESYIWGTAGITSDNGMILINNSSTSNMTRINAKGEILWTRDLSHGKWYAREIVHRRNGHFAVLFYQYATTQYNKSFIAEFDANGDSLFSSGIIPGDLPCGFWEDETDSSIRILYGKGLGGNTELLSLQFDNDLKPINYQTLSPDSSIAISLLFNSVSFNGLVATAGYSNLKPFGILGLHDGLTTCKGKSNIGLEQVNPLTVGPLKQFNTEVVNFDLSEISLNKHVTTKVPVIIKCFHCVAPDSGRSFQIAFCESDEKKLTSTLSGSEFEWSNGTIGKTTKLNAAGTYYLQRKNACGMATDTFVVTFFEAESFEWSVTPKESAPGEEVIFSASGLGKHFQWTIAENIFDTGWVSQTFETPGYYPYKLKVSDESPCSTLIRGKHLVYGFELYFPNAFSPNGDGLNDSFGPVGLGVELIELSIFNRWGEMVFSDKSFWNGHSGKTAAQPGVYFYKAIVKDLKGVERRVSGTVSLVR